MSQSHPDDSLDPWMFRLRVDFADELCFLDFARKPPRPEEVAPLGRWLQEYGFLAAQRDLSHAQLTVWLNSPQRIHPRYVIAALVDQSGRRWGNVFSGGGLVVSYAFEGLIEMAFQRAIAAATRRGYRAGRPEDAVLPTRRGPAPTDGLHAAPLAIGFDSRLGLATLLPRELDSIQKFFRTSWVPTAPEFPPPQR